MGIQVAGRSAEYAWASTTADGAQKAEYGAEWKLVTLLDRATGRDVQGREVERRVYQPLDGFHPQVVFIPGWSSTLAFAVLRWCVRNNVPAVVMCESTARDERRVWWKEWVKRRLVDLCASALVGGAPQADYLRALGLPTERIFKGYNAVDNDYFEREAQSARREAQSAKREAPGGKREAESAGRQAPGAERFAPCALHALPERFFLASARFIEKKNLARLIEAYARYRELSAKRQAPGAERLAPCALRGEPWDLVLLGDGPLRSPLCSLRSALGLDGCVHLPGFKQYPDLPAYYGLASAFVHASTTEQWGLVVNEAMASGLPVLVSNRCGCAQDLVREGQNGFTFDPHNVEQLAELMSKMSAPDFPLSTFGAESRRIIADWGPERFARGLKDAAEKAIEAGPKRARWFDHLLLRGLLLR